MKKIPRPVTRTTRGRKQKQKKTTGPKKLPIAAGPLGFKPVILNVPYLRGADFAGAWEEFGRRFQVAAFEWFKRARGRDLTPEELARRQSERIAAKTGSLISPETLAQIASEADLRRRDAAIDQLSEQMESLLKRELLPFNPVKAGRPRTPKIIERDLRIVKLREEEERSFGQIATKLGKGSAERKTVERAYKRMVKLREELYRRFVELKETAEGFGLVLREARLPEKT